MSAKTDQKPKVGIVEELKELTGTWSDQFLRSHPLLELLKTNQPALLSDVVIQLIQSLARQTGTLVQHLLKSTAALEQMIRLLLGVTVVFTIRNADLVSIGPTQLKHLEATFGATTRELSGKDVEFSAPLVRFVAGGLVIGATDYTITSVTVELPSTLNLKLGRVRTADSKLEAFKTFIKSTSAFPVQKFMDDFSITPEPHTFRDNRGIEVSLDPSHQYVIIEGHTYINATYKPDLATLYFSEASLHRVRTVACSYSNNTFYFEVSETDTKTSPNEEDWEWRRVRMYRMAAV